MNDYVDSLNTGTIYKNDYILADKYLKDIGVWDPKGITKEITGGLCLIVAPTGSGKSILVKHILAENSKEFDSVYLICPTSNVQDIYEFVPDKQRMTTFDESFLNKLWTTQIDIKRKKIRKNILIIMDDVIDLEEFKKSLKLAEMAHGARHIHIYIFLLSQDINSVAPTLRKNARIAISFELPSKKERLKFTEQFMSLENNHIGEILYRKLTGVKYQCVVCLNYLNGESLENKIKKFIADPNKKVKDITNDTSTSSTIDKIESKKVGTYKPYEMTNLF